MRKAGRLIASAVLLCGALVFGTGVAAADTGWQAQPVAAGAVTMSGDTGWQ